MNNETKLTAQDLALYIGCDVEWLGERGCNLAGINTADQSFYPVGLTYSNGLTVWTPERAVKPILRPLSDMTEPEEMEGQNMVDQMGVGYNATHGAKTTRFLLSRHFDLFGWIPAGLAIDKTKIETK